MSGNNTITITGPAGSGKSTIAMIIRNALIGYGIQCEVRDDEIRPEVLAEIAPTLGLRADAISADQTAPIEIKMMHAARGALVSA